MDDKRGLELIVCPVCEGAGLHDQSICVNCAGRGVGAWLDGTWLYYDAKLSGASIALSNFQNRLDKSINYLAYSLAVLALLTFFAGLVITIINQPEVFDLSLLSGRSFGLLALWIGILFLLFSIYRNSLASDSANKIKPWSETAGADKDFTWPKNFKNIKQLNVATSLDKDLERVIAEAFKLASTWRHAEITPLHLWVALAGYNKECQGILGRLNVDSEKLFTKLGHQLAKLPKSEFAPLGGLAFKKTLLSGFAQAYGDKQKAVNAIDLVEVAVANDALLSEALYDLEIDNDKIANVVVWARLNKELLSNYLRYRKLSIFKPSGNMDRAYTALATPLLDRHSRDLTLAAKSGQLDICVGRDTEMRELFDNLKSGKLGVTLVGELGVGKSELIAGLAQLMVTEDVPHLLEDKRLIELDVAGLLGGAAGAVAQERMMVIINEILQAGNIVLFIPDIENLTGLSSGGEGSLDLSEILVSAVTRSGLICLCASTNENYSKFIEHGPIGQNFSKLEIAEPSGNQAIQMIESKISWLEAKYKVYFSYEALADAVALSDRYMHESFLPAKAIDILEKTAVMVAGSKGAGAMIEKADVAAELSKLTHINVTQVAGNEGAELLQLEAKMHERMVGQEEAVATISQSLRRARVELRDGKRPIASFLFLGPTGVGKTELAKTLSAVYFGREDYMVRLDMSEYQASDALAKMIGADGEAGYLTEKVRALPFTLVLLDEIEKAHPDILNLFLQVLDDGRLTDGSGRTIDFTNTIIIATSNIGAVYIQEEIKKNTELSVIKQNIIEKYLVEKMRPELINRFDSIVVFKPLGLSEVAKIARLMLAGVAKMLSEKGMNLEISNEGLIKLAKLGYQPEFGARPLRRLIQDRIENEIANKILSKELKRRDGVLINDQAEVVIKKAKEI